MPDSGDIEEVELGNPAGFIAQAIRSGQNATQALSAYREAGGSARTQTWYGLYGQVSDTLARQPEAANLEPNRIPGAEDYGEWSMGRGGQFATQVQILFRDRETGIIGSAPYTHITDEPHTPDEAVYAGIDLYTNDEAAQRYAQQVLGGVVTNVWQTVPFGAV